VSRVPSKRRLLWLDRHGGEADHGGAMSFVLGVLLFVVVLGVLDARLPWPRPRRGSRL
jgi:hypothetical protein